MDKRAKRAKKRQEREAARRKAGAGAGRPAAGPAQGIDAEELENRAREALAANQPDKAEKHLRQALLAEPDDPRLLTNLIVVLETAERHEEALVVARRCVETNPDFAQGFKSLGTLLSFRGDLAGAEAALRLAIALDPSLGEAWLSLVRLVRFKDAQDPDVVLLLQRLERVPPGSPDRAAMNFAAGKVLEDLGETRASFEHYARGNRQVRAGLRYSSRELETIVDATITAQGEAFFANGPAPHASEEAPILVIGMPRSGSTLVEQILASHAALAGVGEITDLYETLHALGEPDARRAAAVGVLDPREFARLGHVYIARLRRRRPEPARLVDKTLNNWLNVGFVARALPRARILNVVRDPVDNAFACFKTKFTSGLDFTYDLTELGEYYVLYRRLMDHWHAQTRGLVLDVSYEALVADTERETRRILEFLGLDWDPRCLSFHETERRVTSASAAQVRSPIYTTSVQKWRRYERHLAPLLEALGPYAPPPTSSPASAPPLAD